MYGTLGRTVGLRVQACVGDTDEIEQKRTYASNWGQRSVPSLRVWHTTDLESE